MMNLLVGQMYINDEFVFLAVNGCFSEFLEDCNLLMEYVVHVTFWDVFVNSI